MAQTHYPFNLCTSNCYSAKASLRALVFFLLFAGFSCTRNNPSTITAKSPSEKPAPEIIVAESPKPPTIISPKRFSFFENRKNVVLMVSIDGFRFDYLSKAWLPNLEQLATRGVLSEGLIPAFPTLTFPNHVTLITGRSPGRHGIVSNFFYDRTRREYYQMTDGKAVNDGSWYKGEPIWSVLEQVGIKTASCFWVGSEARINNIEPTYVIPYDGSVSNESRAKQVIEWLALPDSKRPQFINLYFSDVDTKGHSFGPDSDQVRLAAQEIDAAIGLVLKYARENQINLQTIVVSDHGMNVIESRRIALHTLADLSGVIKTERGATTQIYSNDARKIDAIYASLKRNERNFKVYRKNEIPKRFLFDHPDRTGDLLVVADLPYYIDTDPSFLPAGAEFERQLGRSTHGWDPANTSMHGFFVAHGSQIRSGLKVPRFDNVHVYPFILELFGLQQSLPIDGSPDVLRDILR